MWTDVTDLRDFYRSSLGHVAQRMIRRRVRDLWPNVRGQAILGLGYATPYLRPFQGEAARIVSFMPAAQGVLRWPSEGPNVVALTNEAELPLNDLSADRVLLVHAIESSEQLRPMLREVWRVLSGSGRLLVVVPNRRGLWARFERTPFGHGHPYTISQLSRLLRDNMFTPVRTEAALFVPPARSRMLLGAAPAWEKLGARRLQAFSGVVLIEAAKEVYAAAGAGEKRARRAVRAPAPDRAAPARIAARESR